MGIHKQHRGAGSPKVTVSASPYLSKGSTGQKISPGGGVSAVSSFRSPSSPSSFRSPSSSLIVRSTSPLSSSLLLKSSKHCSVSPKQEEAVLAVEEQEDEHTRNMKSLQLLVHCLLDLVNVSQLETCDASTLAAIELTPAEIKIQRDLLMEQTSELMTFIKDLFDLQENDSIHNQNSILPTTIDDTTTTTTTGTETSTTTSNARDYAALEQTLQGVSKTLLQQDSSLSSPSRLSYTICKAANELISVVQSTPSEEVKVGNAFVALETLMEQQQKQQQKEIMIQNHLHLADPTQTTTTTTTDVVYKAHDSSTPPPPALTNVRITSTASTNSRSDALKNQITSMFFPPDSTDEGDHETTTTTRMTLEEKSSTLSLLSLELSSKKKKKKNEWYSPIRDDYIDEARDDTETTTSAIRALNRMGTSPIKREEEERSLSSSISLSSHHSSPSSSSPLSLSSLWCQEEEETNGTTSCLERNNDDIDLFRNVNAATADVCQTLEDDFLNEYQWMADELNNILLGDA